MNIKQRTAMYLAVALFAGSILCAMESWAALGLLLAILGLFSGIATWALGLSRKPDATEAEWMNAIR